MAVKYLFMILEFCFLRPSGRELWWPKMCNGLKSHVESQTLDTHSTTRMTIFIVRTMGIWEIACSSSSPSLSCVENMLECCARGGGLPVTTHIRYYLIRNSYSQEKPPFSIFFLAIAPWLTHILQVSCTSLANSGFKEIFTHSKTQAEHKYHFSFV